MTKLAGFEKPPRQPQAAHVWAHANWKEGVQVGKTVQSSWAGRADKTLAKRPINFGTDMVRKAFAALAPEERQKWNEEAKAQGERAKAEYRVALKEPPSREPDARALYVTDDASNLC